jgi:DNA repair protein RadD
VAHGVVRSDVATSSHGVQVAMVQTLANRIKLDKTGRFKFDLVIVDEAHHATRASQWGAILDYNATAQFLGVSATPCRLDGKGLGKAAHGFFDAMVIGPTVGELIARGRLASPVVYAPREPLRLGKVQKRGGDFIRSQLVDAVDWEIVTQQAVESYQRWCDRQSAIAFTVDVERAGRTAEVFKNAGYSAAVLDGSTPDKERLRMIRDLGDGQLNVLASCNVVSEGTDIPRVSAAVLLRPTASYSLCMQQIGRALRVHPGKDQAIILDHADNVRQHGLPTDEVLWSLEGLGKKKRSATVKQCLCGALLPSPARICGQCGHVFEAFPVDQKDFNYDRDGELIEMTPEMLDAERTKKRTELVRARTEQELIALGMARNYKNPRYWAQQIIKGRQQYHHAGQANNQPRSRG